MDTKDPAQWRLVPSVYDEGEVKNTIGSAVSESKSFFDIRSLFNEYRLTGLGMLLPFSWQLHWYLYTQARENGMYTAVAMPTNVSALSGLMRSVPIDAVITTKSGADRLVQDLRAQGMLEQIKLWILVLKKDETCDFSVLNGSVVTKILP